MQRVIVFIDGSNLYSHLRDTYGEGKVHLPKLSQYLTGDARTFLQWRYYCAPLPQGHTPEERESYASQQRFLSFVRNHRKGELCLGRFEADPETGKLREKGVDVRLAVDVVRLAAQNRYDVAIIISGDGDLVPAVETVKEIYGKRVEVAIPPVDAYHMRQAADSYAEITSEVFEQMRIQPPAERPPATLDDLKGKFNRGK